MSKHEQIFTKLGKCIDIGFELLMDKFHQVLTELSAQMAGYYSLTFLFLDNLYVFVWLEHGCSRNMVFVSVSNNSFIKMW